jgi:hypothetical protein
MSMMKPANFDHAVQVATLRGRLATRRWQHEPSEADNA